MLLELHLHREQNPLSPHPEITTAGPAITQLDMAIAKRARLLPDSRS